MSAPLVNTSGGEVIGQGEPAELLRIELAPIVAAHGADEGQRLVSHGPRKVPVPLLALLADIDDI